MTTAQRIWLLAGAIAGFGAGIALHVGAAHAATPLQTAAAAFPNSPCTTTVILWARQSSAGAATGVDIQPDGSYLFNRCEITLDPDRWARFTPAKQCEIVVHEAGHLAGLHHTPTGIMAPVVGYWAPCHTVRERVRHDVALRVPDDSLVVCGRWTSVISGTQKSKKAMWCVAEWQSERNWLRRARFRVRVLGDVYAIQRVKLRHPELHH